ncbi:MAG: hypothetical protein AB8B58_14350 [Roseobacter sp.]
MNLRWLMRMSLWARRPPSKRQIIMVGCVLFVCITLALIETLGFWPHTLTTHSMRP